MIKKEEEKGFVKGGFLQLSRRALLFVYTQAYTPYLIYLGQGDSHYRCNGNASRGIWRLEGFK